MTTTARQRVFVSWREFGAMALEHYRVTNGECWPVVAREHVIDGRRSDVRIVLANDECGQVATYRPGIDDDGRAYVKRLRNDERKAMTA